MREGERGVRYWRKKLDRGLGRGKVRKRERDGGRDGGREKRVREIRNERERRRGKDN